MGVLENLRAEAAKLNPANIAKHVEGIAAKIEAFESRLIAIESFIERSAPAIRALAVLFPGPIPTEVSLLLAVLPKATDTAVNVLKTVDATLKAESPTPAKIETVPNPAQGSASIVPGTIPATLPTK